jgi:hypothetical protein
MSIGAKVLSHSSAQQLSESSVTLVAAVLAGFVALIVAIIGAMAAYFATKREARRITYSKAVRAATAWKELLYRVRRRNANQASDIVQLFHEAQDDLSYYQAWIGADSRSMARSYRRLVEEVKQATQEPIKKAWAEPIRPVPGDALPDDLHPDLQMFVAAFLDDVRSHLSPWPWRKLQVVWRNRKDS